MQSARRGERLPSLSYGAADTSKGKRGRRMSAGCHSERSEESQIISSLRSKSQESEMFRFAQHDRARAPTTRDARIGRMTDLGCSCRVTEARLRPPFSRRVFAEISPAI
jgi:hypothetical protein